MSGSASSAFGSYMRTLRERRGLSLPAVCRLFEGTAERIDRGSLWRLEHGEHGLSIGKLSLLARIYGVSPEVLTERLELDRELEHFGAPRTEPMLFEELIRHGREALIGHRSKWHAYAFFRDAEGRADGEGAARRVRLNLATAMRSLGKNRLALHELSELESETRETDLHPVVLDRIANCQRCLGRLDAARRVAETALERVERENDSRVRALIHSSRANIALARAEPDRAVEHLTRALEASHDPDSANGALRPSPGFEVTTLNMLAEVQLLARRHGPAKEAAMAAGKIARRYRIPLGLGHSELALGRLDEAEGRPAAADERWHRVVVTARRIGDRRLAFAGEFYRFRRALQAGETSLARASRKRLERLEPWIPRHFPLVDAYRELAENSTAERTISTRRSSRTRRRPS